MRTPISIQALIVNSDDTPASGSLCVRANEADYSPVIFTGAPTCGVLDLDGRLVTQGYTALTVNASDDEGFDTVYTFQSSIVGQPNNEFQCYVPGDSTATEQAAQTTEGSDVVTLTSLIAAAAMLGQTIVGDNWPDDTIVQAISVIYNTVTLSNPATVTGVCTAVVGGAVMLDTLVANQL